MRKRFALFVEDHAHRLVIGALIRRVAEAEQVEVELDFRSATRGYSRVVAEYHRYLQDLRRDRQDPDVIVVGTDANCKGVSERTRELGADTLGIPVVHAIPDPHIERWLLIDSAAFKSVLGRGCAAPDQKCARDRYKAMLSQAVVDAGVIPSLGGIEYAEDLVAAMDLERIAAADASMNRFLAEVRRLLRR